MIKPLIQIRLLTAVLAILFLPILVSARTQSVLITDFGAVGDSKTLNTQAIQAAIEAVHAAYGALEGLFQ